MAIYVLRRPLPIFTLENAMHTELVQAQIVGLSTDSTPDQMAAATEAVAAVGQAYHQLKDYLKEAKLEWIEANGPLEWGKGVCDCVVDKKTVKVKDQGEALDAVVNACDGDVETVASYMGSQPWQYGKLRSLLGDQWENIFETRVERDIRTGKPKREVRRIDARYIKNI